MICCCVSSRLFGNSRGADVRSPCLPSGENQTVAAVDEGSHLRSGLHCGRHHFWGLHHSYKTQAMKNWAHLCLASHHILINLWTDLIFLDEMEIMFPALLWYFAMANAIYCCLIMVIFCSNKSIIRSPPVVSTFFLFCLMYICHNGIEVKCSLNFSYLLDSTCCQ